MILTVKLEPVRLDELLDELEPLEELEPLDAILVVPLGVI